MEWLIVVAFVVLAFVAGRFAVDSRDGNDWQRRDWRDGQRERDRQRKGLGNGLRTRLRNG